MKAIYLCIVFSLGVTDKV